MAHAYFVGTLMSDLDRELCNAVMTGNATGDEVRALVARGASPDAASAGMTALHWAARNGLADAVTALLALGADRESRSTNAASNATPMHSALWVGATDDAASAVVRALLAAGASPAATDARGEIPVHRAAELGLPTVIDVLAPVSPLESRTNAGSTPLAAALVQREVTATLRLLVHGAPVDDDAVKLASHLGPRVRELVEAARTGTLHVSAFTAFACLLAEHLEDGPGIHDTLSVEDARGLLGRLATALGESVGAGLPQNTDVDHFTEEYGDNWLDELVDSYWMDAYEKIVSRAWSALPAETRTELDLEAVLDNASEQFATAIRNAS